MSSNLSPPIGSPSHSLVKFILEKVALDEEIIASIHALAKIGEYTKNHTFIREGQLAHRIYFIDKGSARTYYNHDGKDITSWIYREGQLFTSWSSFFNRTPSHENVELTEDSVIVSLSYDQLQHLYEQNTKMQKFGRLMVEEQLVFLDFFYKGFMFMTAKEKYDLLLSTFPDVTQRVNLGHVASFLGISQETLSRIRKKK